MNVLVVPCSHIWLHVSFLVAIYDCMTVLDDEVCHDMSFRLWFSWFLKWKSSLYGKIVHNWRAEKVKNCDGAGERYDNDIEKMKKKEFFMAFKNIWYKFRKHSITGSGQTRDIKICLICPLNRHLRKIWQSNQKIFFSETP